MDDLLPPVTRGLVELFEGPLRDVRFPDADLDGLRRAIDEAAKAREALVNAELALQSARQALDEQNEIIARRTDRSLAYARIYAAERPEILLAVESLASTPAPSRPRGRPRKEAKAFVGPEERQVEIAVTKRRSAAALESAAE